MKASKELNEALQAISKEVEAWPEWKRSIDPRENLTSSRCANSGSKSSQSNDSHCPVRAANA